MNTKDGVIRFSVTSKNTNNNLNTNLFKNEVANKLVAEKDCDFSVVYNYDDNKSLTKFSLRSIESKADVGQVSKSLGGGGHRNAAGFTRFGFHNSLI